ncbi:hypothetical protein AAG570_012062, partial [Ranatra chinensis]
RYLRNSELRREAREEQNRIGQTRLENQLFSTRCSHQPTTVQFHPYDSQIIIAYKDSFTIWDYGNGNKICTVRNSGTERRGSGSRVTSLQYINGHDVALVVTGADDGAVRVWRQCGTLLTAWQALGKSSMPSSCYSGSLSGMVMAWDQLRQELIVGGDSRNLKVWDADKELKVCDIPTGADSCITCISLDPSGGWLMGVGCGDGTVRLFDRRISPLESRVMTYREHTAWVVAVGLSPGANSLISGSTCGDVRKFDTRKHSSELTCQAQQGMKAMAVHPAANIFACGSVNQISVFRSSGASLNLIKSAYHEWFYSPRFGPVGCLTFHPHRVLLAAGSVDSTLSIYSADPKR